MGYSAVVRALQQQREVMVATLLELQFKSGTQYLWDGVGPFTDLNGQPWSGVGSLVSISEFDRDLVSGQTPSLVLSGVDTSLVPKALAASSEVKGRWFKIFEQYFTRDTLAALDTPKCILLGAMDRPSIDVANDKATVTVSTTTVMHRRRRVALAYLSDATQQTLYPGDRGCSELSRLVQAQEIWPGYNG